MRKPLVIVAALAAVALTPSPALAVDDVNTSRLRRAVTVDGILAHERVLQRIANRNGGTRASGTAGFDASAAYVASRLRSAGYHVTEQKFTFPFFRDLEPAEAQQISPTPAEYQTEAFQYSGSGDLTATVVATNDVVIPPAPAPSSTSGCQSADFVPASPTAPQIALIQRGGCTFAAKVANAVAAGYDAVIIFNEGQPGRDDLVTGTLGGPVDVPVIGLSFADGAALYAAAQAGVVTVRVFAKTETNLTAVTSNILADSPAGNPDKVVVVGAHLDSVVEGPGINDNGSGTAAILEIAEEMAALQIRPRQKLRFAFWGAEEVGLLGSTHYVDSLTDDELSTIRANLNFDMIGSPNYVRFVYDGDGSDTPVAGPPGSAEIEQVFATHFARANLATEPTAFDGRSDYGPFIAVGVPAGGLFSGAEGIKTAEQAATYGGVAGKPYDACYHQACDTIRNLNTAAISELGDAAAHATMVLARTRTGLFGDGARVAARAGVRSLDYLGHHAIR